MNRHELLHAQNNQIFSYCNWKCGTKVRGMYLFGSTTGWSRDPLFIVDRKRKMLPRPVQKVDIYQRDTI